MGGCCEGYGVDCLDPNPTICGNGISQRIVAWSLATLRGDNTGRAAGEPLRTASACREHHAVVQYTLSPEQEAGALRVAAFLVNYYGNGQPLDQIGRAHV